MSTCGFWIVHPQTIQDPHVLSSMSMITWRKTDPLWIAMHVCTYVERTLHHKIIKISMMRVNCWTCEVGMLNTHFPRNARLMPLSMRSALRYLCVCVRAWLVCVCVCAWVLVRVPSIQKSCLKEKYTGSKNSSDWEWTFHPKMKMKSWKTSIRCD